MILESGKNKTVAIENRIIYGVTFLMVSGHSAGYSGIQRDSETQKFKTIIPFTTYLMCI